MIKRGHSLIARSKHEINIKYLRLHFFNKNYNIRGPYQTQYNNKSIKSCKLQTNFFKRNTKFFEMPNSQFSMTMFRYIDDDGFFPPEHEKADSRSQDDG